MEMFRGNEANVDELRAAIATLKSWNPEDWAKEQANSVAYLPNYAVSSIEAELQPTAQMVDRYVNHIIRMFEPLLDGSLSPGAILTVRSVLARDTPQLNDLIKQVDPKTDTLTVAQRIRLRYPETLRNHYQAIINDGAQAAAERALVRPENPHEDLVAEGKQLLHDAAVLRGILNALQKDVDSQLNKLATHKQAGAFGKQSVEFKEQAEAWLVSTIMAMFVFVVAICWLMFSPGPRNGLELQPWYVAGNLSHFAPRVTLVAFLSSVLAICVRNFRTARHNEVVNAHKGNTLETVLTLSKGSNSERQGRLVELAATSVFSPAATGFETREPHIKEVSLPGITATSDGN